MKGKSESDKPLRKTYAARGMIDWQWALNVGGAIIRICFSGGSMGTNGVIPAKYTTESPAIQQMIERSREMKSGRIVLYKKEELNDDENGDVNRVGK